MQSAIVASKLTASSDCRLAATASYITSVAIGHRVGIDRLVRRQTLPLKVGSRRCRKKHNQRQAFERRGRRIDTNHGYDVVVGVRVIISRSLPITPSFEHANSKIKSPQAPEASSVFPVGGSSSAKQSWLEKTSLLESQIFSVASAKARQPSAALYLAIVAWVTDRQVIDCRWYEARVFGRPGAGCCQLRVRTKVRQQSSRAANGRESRCRKGVTASCSSRLGWSCIRSPVVWAVGHRHCLLKPADKMPENRSL